MKLIRLSSVAQQDVFINPYSIAYVKESYGSVLAGTEVKLVSGDSFTVTESLEEVAELCKS